MAKDPAFLFYSKDFLSGIQDLTMEERGQYITLLCLQHQKGHLSEKAIKLCVGNAAADVMAKFRQDTAGLWYNIRLEEEAKKREAHAEKQKARATEGWKKRKNQTNQEKDKQSGIQYGNAAALPLVNANAIVNVNSIDNLLKESFDENYFASIEMTYRSKDIKQEFDYFSQKVRGSPKDYEHRDTGKIRMAFEYQLRNAKDKQHVRGSNKTTSTGVITDFSNANYKTKL